jgi:putative ATP-dependent endonuclease of the OLD family
MRVVQLRIERFRSIRSATLFPADHNVYLGPNNLGKTAILEALNLLLNPEIATRGAVVDENDFYCREYRLPPAAPTTAPTARDGAEAVAGVAASEGAPASAVAETNPATEPLLIRIEAVLTNLDDEDLGEFSSILVPWDPPNGRSSRVPTKAKIRSPRRSGRSGRASKPGTTRRRTTSRTEASSEQIPSFRATSPRRSRSTTSAESGS